MARLVKRFGMFTSKGNYMVERIAEAGKKLATEDGCGKNAWAFAYRDRYMGSSLITVTLSRTMCLFTSKANKGLTSAMDGAILYI